MSASDITVIAAGGALARSKKAKSSATAGLALINEVLSPDVVQAMVDADRFRRWIQDDHTYLGSDGACTEIRDDHARFVDRATPLLRRWLPDIARAVAVDDVLFRILHHPPDLLSSADATAMLNYLFGAMGKRRNDEAAAKLIACCDVFSPTSNALGEALGLWKAAPTHPVILAITIKRLMAEKTFEPAEAELREALGKVQERLYVQEAYVQQWLARIDRADEMVFRFDRPAWDAAYATASSAAPLAMQSRLFGEEPGEEEDDDGNVQPPSPRWAALNDLIEGKRAIEKRVVEQPVLPEPLREAACEAKPMKRTRKPKRRE
jgi:hypothetical protein